jgi:tyrosyl-tRNA synthetase
MGDAMDLLDDLDARGLIHDSTDRAALAARLRQGPISVYVGFDPTSDSLHAGNLVGQVMLRRFQLAGHKPYPLAGGATGMVGDPSGRSDERNLLTREMLQANLVKIKSQLERLLDFSPGPLQAVLVDNAAWTEQVGVLEFLRDVGKHITVNQMLAKDSVRSRLDSETGMSFTEFSYMLLQANDFRHLYEHHHVEMQMGGSDQWGNITAGAEQIRRRLGQTAYGLTWPLLTRTDGQKMGKSVAGALWLDPAKTSPYQFRQYWMQLPDDDVERFLLQLTLRPLTEIAELIEAHRADPGKRLAQRALAADVTGLVHGHQAADAAEQAAAVLFGGDPLHASPEAFAVVVGEVPKTTVECTDLGDLVALLVKTGLASSNGDARRGLQQRAYRLNGRQIDIHETSAADEKPLHNRYILLRKGKSSYHLLEISSS